MKDLLIVEDFLSAYYVLHPVVGTTGRSGEEVLVLEGLLAFGQDPMHGPLWCPSPLCCRCLRDLCRTLGEARPLSGVFLHLQNR